MAEEEKSQDQLDQDNAAQATEVENRAKIQGWVSKEEFRGDEARWIPADEFVKRADHMMPILKSVNRKLETQVSEMNRKLADTQDTIHKMVKINEKYSEDLYGTKLSEVQGAQRKAAQDGNLEEYDRLEQQKTKLVKPEKIEIKQPPPIQNQAALDQWVESNKSWFNVDKEMTDYAFYLGEQMKNTRSPLAAEGQEAAFCAEIERKIKTTFPQKFSNPNRNRSEIDESRLRGGEVQDNGGRKSWNDLPSDARSHANKLMAEIPGYTKEKYLKDYFEGV